MNESQGFWSYVHSDDEADGGRIIRLAKDVVNQYEMLTGEAIDLFLDKDAIKWGDDWRDKVDVSLSSIAFFIAVLTPRYFMSPECRRELNFFARRATKLGIKELVLPLLYVDVPSLHDNSNTDELCALVTTFQWEDWRELRFVEVTSEGYRRGVAKIAARLVEANRHAELVSHETPERASIIESDAEDESPGLIDRVAQAEAALPEFQKVMEGIAKEIETVGKILGKATESLNKPANAAKGFSYKVTVARRVAQQLQQPVERLYALSHAFAAKFHDLDQGIQAIIGAVFVELQEKPEFKSEVCEFFRIVRGLAGSADTALGHVQRMIDVVAPIEKTSRDMRLVLRRLRQGLTVMAESRAVGHLWVSLIDGTGVDCGVPTADAL